MTKTQFKVETGLELKNCITCGITYAMPTKFIKEKREDHATFYCPNGHKMYFPYLTKEEILTRKLESCKLSDENHRRESRYYDYKARYWRGRAEKIQKAKEIQL